MDVFKLAPQVSEDTLEYRLYPPRGFDHDPAILRTLILEYATNLPPSTFIWHRDPFELNVQYANEKQSRSNPQISNSKSWMFEGRMRVGDCVDDEWCSVWLLREITLKWDLLVSVRDSDGEFLLIEAAEALPSWITPENAENRVWIYKGQLHLVPLQHVSDPSTRPARPIQDETDEDFRAQNESEPYLNVQDAIEVLLNDNTSTLADEKTQQAAWNRVVKYPSALAQHTHRTNAYLPFDIARTLSVNPALVQRAVEAFYTRDVLQLRAAQKMARFPPKPDVLASVLMTRPAYAQLVGQVFHPPKVFGVWQETEGTPERRWRDIGMKIACGFEMLYAESKGSVRSLVSDTAASKEARIDALRRDPDYSAYIRGLEKAGYFGDEIDGSQKYKQREQAAADMYIQFRTINDATRPSFATYVEAALCNSPEPFTISETPEEDPTEWLEIDENDFDVMLGQKFNRSNAAEQSGVDAEDKMTQEQAIRLRELAKKVEGFVEGKGDLEGARFDDDILEDQDMGPDSDDESAVSDQPDKQLRQQAMDKLVPPLEPGDYGQMPAAYSNSQSVSKSALESETHVPEDTDMPALSGSHGTLPAEPQNASSSEARERLLRRPILPRDRFDGVDSDDDTDDDDLEAAVKRGLPDDGSESEEDRPTVVGEIEIDMDEEQDEFIRFSREALGIDDGLWSRIMEERSHRGAFTPMSKSGTKDEDAPVKPLSDDLSGNEKHWFDAPPDPRAPRAPRSGPRPNGNPNLDSFEAVMEAMEAELKASRDRTKAQSLANKAPEPKGKGKEVPSRGKNKRVRITGNDDTENIEDAMERELRATLGENDSDEEDASMDYNLIKNFLESWKGQSGLAGPVSSLAGRLQQDWALPQDNDR